MRAVVIGSGIAGISTTEILSRNGWDVILLEQSDKLGGEASLATQKWFHTGWLYSSMPNKSALIGCYKAMQLYRLIYNINVTEMNLLPPTMSTNSGAMNSIHGWFDDDHIYYLFSKNGFDVDYWKSIGLRYFWMPFNSLGSVDRDWETTHEYYS